MCGPACACTGLGGALGWDTAKPSPHPDPHSPADFFRQEAWPSAEGSEAPSPPPNSEPKQRNRPSGAWCSQWTPVLGTGLIQPFEWVPPPPPPSGSDLAEKPGVIPVIRQSELPWAPLKPSWQIFWSLLPPPASGPWTAVATWPQRPLTSCFFQTLPQTQAFFFLQKAGRLSPSPHLGLPRP